jgi:hypothetical protein
VKSNRLAGLALVALAAASLTAAGCAQTTAGSPGAAGSGSASGSPSVSASASTAVAAIASSTRALGQTSYTFSVHSRGLTGQGAADPTHQQATISLSSPLQSGTATMDLVLLNQQAWLKVSGLTGIPASWMHLDVSRIGNGLGVSLTGNDPVDTSSLLAGVVSAQQVDDRHYTAIIDLTKAGGVAVDPATVAKLGDRAKAVPAKITVDDQGRLTDLTLDLASLDASLSPLEISYSGYGDPVNVTQPAATGVVEAPDALYHLFGS